MLEREEESLRHFLSLGDLTAGQLAGLLDLAARLKEAWRGGAEEPILGGRTLAMIFQKPSLRTRVSFEEAMNDLGGRAMYLSPQEVQLGARESVPDVARVLSGYVDAILARVFAHDDLLLLADHSRVPVINGLSDYSHPCQGLSDLFTIREALGRLAGVRLAYVGDGNNVCHSLLLGGSRLGMDLRVASPPGYEPRREVVEQASRQAQESGGKVRVTPDPAEAVRDADIVYTDVWTSMGQEAEAERRRRVFGPYQVNGELLSRASLGARVMHCLPAHRGEEISDEVMDSPQALVFTQAENRLHAQKALLVQLLADGRLAGGAR